MITESALRSFERIETPFFYYDMDILRRTVDNFASTLRKYGITAHYAVKANSNDRILRTISGAGIQKVGDSKMGTMVCDITGNPKAVEAALKAIRERGVKVEEVQA